MSRQILVVDDEPNVRLNYRVALETESFTVREANCGARALEQFAAHHFDLAILDMRMPGMDGLDLLAEMRKEGIDTPAVIITAYGDILHAMRAMKLGAIDFLKKPVTPEQLRHIAEEVIERHEKPASPPSKVVADPVLSPGELHMRYLVNAKRLLNLRDFESARTNLSKAMALDPLSPEAFNLAGVLFEMREDYDRAKKFYAQALKLAQDYAPAQENMRRLFERFQTGSSKEPHSPGDDQ
jgi:DNA-binding response OmpR family regulator